MREIYKHNDKAYFVICRKPESKFHQKGGQTVDMEMVKVYRDWVKADHVLRDQTHFIFCETIDEAEIIE